MLAAARRARSSEAPVGIELLFTVVRGDRARRRQGVRRDEAAQPLRLRLRPRHARSARSSSPRRPTTASTAEFHGKAAHAGIRPEDGRSAIVAAARAIAALDLGRLDDETTANVGTIEGGAGGTNVVPDRCRFLAEARSLDARKAERGRRAMVDRIQDAANDPTCDVDVDVDVERLFTRLPPRARRAAGPRRRARAASAAATRPRRIVTGGGSDANALEASGFPCTNLANGTERNHEPTERVSVAALEGMLDVTLALLEESRVTPRAEHEETIHDGPRFTVNRGDVPRRRATREWVEAPAAVAVVAYDDEHVYLVSQPREAIGRDDVLELPAGLMDVEGECAARDRQARARRGDRHGGRATGSRRRRSSRARASPTRSSHVFLATGLTKVGEPDESEEEQIELVTWPLADLDGLIDSNADAKTLVGLLWLQRARERGRQQRADRAGAAARPTRRRAGSASSP